MNLFTKELIYIAKKHLALILVVLMAAGLFYFLIPYVAIELTNIDKQINLFTFFLPLSSCQNYPETSITDPAGDQIIAQNDITTVELTQIANNTLQIKVSVRGNPLDLRDSHYLVFFDSDNNPDTGRYWSHWNIGEDFTVRIGYDENANKWFAGAESIKEGSMASLPLLIKDNSVYVLVSLVPYKNSYVIGNSIKFAIDVVSIPGEGDYVGNVGELDLVNNLTNPSFRILSENEIFSNSPHSIYLDYRQRDNPLNLTVSNNPNNTFFFSTNNEIAEIINGNQVRTNFDIINEERNSDFSYISAYIPECDLMISDYLMAISGSELFKSAKAAFVMPPYVYNQNTGEYLDFSSHLRDYEVARVSSLAVEIQNKLVGMMPFDGDNRIFAYNYPACGWAGQPIWFGWGCVLQPYIDGQLRPAWGMYYHELGHIILTHIFSSKFPGLTYYDWGRYGESWASLNSMYTINKLITNEEQYNFKQEIINTLQSVKNNFRTFYIDDQGGGESLWKYINIYNKDFTKLDANIMDGIFIVLAEDKPVLNPYGWEIYPRFYKVFLPQYWDTYVNVEDGLGETFFIAALSAAAGNDLRPLFVDEWNFPIDNIYYNTLFPILENIIQPLFIAPDINQDGQVDSQDLNIFKPIWGSVSSIADFNQDGLVNSKDLGIMVSSWKEQ